MNFPLSEIKIVQGYEEDSHQSPVFRSTHPRAAVIAVSIACPHSQLTGLEDRRPDDMTTLLKNELDAHNFFFQRIISLIPSELYGHLNSSTTNASIGQEEHDDSSNQSDNESDVEMFRRRNHVEDSGGGVTAVNEDESSQDESESEMMKDQFNSKYFKHVKQPLSTNERKLLSKRAREEKYKSLAPDALQLPIAPFDEGRSGYLQDDTTTKHALDSLRERLQRKILDMRSKRTSQKQYSESQVSSRLRTGEKNNEYKRELSKTSKNDVKLSHANEINRDIRHDILNDEINDQITSNFDSRGESTQDASHGIEDSGDIDFGSILVPSKRPKLADDVGKPGSKVRRLKRMLQEAEKKKKRLVELKQQGEDGVKRAHAEQWNDVVKGVSGEKIFEDTRKLRKALKRKEQAKAKSAVEWKDRIDKLSLTKSAKIEKREKNIANRNGREYRETFEDETVAPKSRGKKNEKNAPRAGFEGKKIEFLNKNTGNNGPT